jgi:hypothetical protein
VAQKFKYIGRVSQDLKVVDRVSQDLKVVGRVSQDLKVVIRVSQKLTLCSKSNILRNINYMSNIYKRYHTPPVSFPARWRCSRNSPLTLRGRSTPFS